MVYLKKLGTGENHNPAKRDTGEKRPMANLKDHETQTKIAMLVVALRNGENVNEELIQLHKKYIEGIAWRFGWKLINLRNDLRSAALLGLIQAVKWIQQGRCHHTEYSAYIITTCTRFIRDEISKSYGVYVPSSSVNAGIVESYATVLSYDNAIETRQISGKPKEQFVIVARKDQTQELKEELDSVNLTWRERRIIEMRLDGYTDEEIGKIFYVTKMRISQIRAQIQLKFQYLLERK